MEIINPSPDSSQNQQINKETNTDIKIHLNYSYYVKINISEKMTLSELKNEISKNYFISDNEYELFIGSKNINNESNNTLVTNLFEKYKSNNIIIKTNKNIFDLQNQLNSYDNFLTKKISLKTEEINLLSEEIESLKNDLKNIK